MIFELPLKQFLPATQIKLYIRLVFFSSITPAFNSLQHSQVLFFP